MAGLQELKTRIETVKSTQKITSAMKMVAAARLRRSQSFIEKSESYNHNILGSANRVLYELREQEKERSIPFSYPVMMTGNGKNLTHLLLVFTSDRGLCGGFNSGVVKIAVNKIEELLADGKNVKIICIGKKGKDLLKRKYGNLILDSYEGIAKKGAKYFEASDIAYKVMDMFNLGEFDVCDVIVSRFFSAITREVICKQILPVAIENYEYNKLHLPQNVVMGAYYDYEPHKMQILEGLLPLVFRESIFQCIIHSQASEHGSRMTSMDNATRNAKDMISQLTLKYNRIRQTAITTELTEIISGAEAL